MAQWWRTLQQEVRGTVDDIRAKGAIAALRDTALDARDMAADAGTWVRDGVKSFLDEDGEMIAQSFVLRCEGIPVRGATAQLELPDGSTVEAVVVDVDGISTPPRARVTIPGKPEPLMVTILPPGVPREGLGEAREEGSSRAPASLLSGLREELTATVQEFREKGAVSTVRDAAFDAVDIVGATAKSAVDSARSIASPLFDPDWEPKEGVEAAEAASAAGGGKERTDASGAAASGDGAAGPGSGAAPSGGGAADAIAAAAAAAEGSAGSSKEAGNYAEALWAGLKEEWNDTVQDFRQKGAVGSVKDATLDAVDIVGNVVGAVADTTRTYAAPLLERAPDAVASVGNTAAAVAKQTQAYAAPMLERASELWTTEQGEGGTFWATEAAATTKQAGAAQGSARFAPPARSSESEAPASSDHASAAAAPTSMSGPPKDGALQRKEEGNDEEEESLLNDNEEFLD